VGERAHKTALYEQFSRVGKALANPTRLELLDLLAQRERRVEELAETAGMKVSNTSELLRRLHHGEVLVLDVRPEAEYAAGHIPGAVNVPHDQLAARLAELPESSEIVAYCRGRHCMFTPDAVRLLRARGLSAWPLEGGLPDWRLAGRPVTDRASA
jgi:rhodanese-related sulfurtransferase